LRLGIAERSIRCRVSGHANAREAFEVRQYSGSTREPGPHRLPLFHACGDNQQAGRWKSKLGTYSGAFARILPNSVLAAQGGFSLVITPVYSQVVGVPWCPVGVPGLQPRFFLCRPQAPTWRWFRNDRQLRDGASGEAKSHWRWKSLRTERARQHENMNSDPERKNRMGRPNQPPQPECCRAEGQATASDGAVAEQPPGGVHRDRRLPQAGVTPRL